VSLFDWFLNLNLIALVFGAQPLLSRISLFYAIFTILIAALILVYAKFRVKSIKKKLEDEKKKLEEAYAKDLDKAVTNLHNKIPLTRNDFTLATKFGKSIQFLASDLPHHFLDDEWQCLDPAEAMYVPKAHYDHVVEDFEQNLISFTLRNHDGESHLELSYIVYILQNPEKFSPESEDGYGGVDELIDWIQEAADISGWDELEKIINRIDLTDFRTSPMYSIN